MSCAEAHAMSERTGFESMLLRERWLIGGALLLIIALCWAWLIPMGRDMYGSMDGAAAWMMTRNWDLPHSALLLAMWVVMMVGMMLPSAAPILFLYAGVIRKSPNAGSVSSSVYSFGSGYLLVWAAFSLLATALQLLLSKWLLLNSMMEARSRIFAAALLLVAGAYQFTPYKRTCLQSCRAPVVFLTQHWKPGLRGAFQLGWQHGLYCLGCCWALMLLLFVGGVMNLWWVGAITVFVLLEKLAPVGVQGGKLSGVLIIGLGAWNLFFRIAN